MAKADRSYPKRERLLKRIEFDAVLEHGKKRRVESCFTVFILDNGRVHRRLGIIASKKIGNACTRNRVKRKVREAYRLIRHALRPSMDIVVIAGKGLVALPFADLETKLLEALPRGGNA